jgi:alpha-mannosidase
MPPATVANPTPPQILTTLDRLRSLSQRDVLSTWRHSLNGAEVPPPVATGCTWPIATLNDRRHLPWPQGKVPLGLYQRFTWPQALNGYPIQGLTARLALRWWANHVDIFVDGAYVQSGDIFDCWTRVLLTDGVVPGESVDVFLHLLSPGHDQGALVQAELVFETEDDCPEPGFIADELAVLATYLAQYDAEQLDTLSQALGGIAWAAVSDRPRFDQSLLEVRAALQQFSPWLKQRTVRCLGHAHLDLAWLWPVPETWVVAENTFRSVLALQQEFPELTFTHSSPALFAWLEQHCPELFNAIQQQVEAGRWAIDAGTLGRARP